MSTSVSSEPAGFVLKSDLITAALVVGGEAFMKSSSKIKGDTLVMHGVESMAISSLGRYLDHRNFLNSNSLLNLWEDSYTYQFVLATLYANYKKNKTWGNAAQDGIMQALSNFIADSLAKNSGGDSVLI